MQMFCLLFLFASCISLCSEQKSKDYVLSLQKHYEKKNVFFAKTEDQHDTRTSAYQRYANAHLDDHTCLYRVFLGGYYLVDGLTDESKSDKIAENLLTKMNEPFFGVLNFDSFVNPHLFSKLCDDVIVGKLNDETKSIADKLVYFNTDRRYAPVAGVYRTSYVKTETFKTIQQYIADNISSYEPDTSIDGINAFKYGQEEKLLDPSLCFNADYKKLLENVENMQKMDNYTFGFISTKYGGENGHGMLIIAHKKNKDLQFICADGCNIALKYEKNWFDISQRRLERMIEDPSFLKDTIVRYICLTKPHGFACTEIEELGLQ